MIVSPKRNLLLHLLTPKVQEDIPSCMGWGGLLNFLCLHWAVLLHALALKDTSMGTGPDWFQCECEWYFGPQWHLRAPGWKKKKKWYLTICSVLTSKEEAWTLLLVCTIYRKTYRILVYFPWHSVHTGHSLFILLCNLLLLGVCRTHPSMSKGFVFVNPRPCCITWHIVKTLFFLFLLLATYSENYCIIEGMFRVSICKEWYTCECCIIQ